jgi:hypothetical protein
MNDNVLDNILGQTSKIAWRELARFFAGGKVLLVDNSLNLVEVAAAVSSDNTQAVSQWVAVNQLAAVSDEQALDWQQKDEHLWAVVTAPWVLVQLIKKQ